MDHQVGPFPQRPKHKAAFCHVGRFAAQMAYLRLVGYNVISLEQLHRGLFHRARRCRRAAWC